MIRLIETLIIGLLQLLSMTVLPLVVMYVVLTITFAFEAEMVLATIIFVGLIVFWSYLFGNTIK